MASLRGDKQLCPCGGERGLLPDGTQGSQPQAGLSPGVIGRCCGPFLQPPGGRHPREKRHFYAFLGPSPADHCQPSSGPPHPTFHKSQSHSLGQQASTAQYACAISSHHARKDRSERGDPSRNLSIQNDRRGTCRTIGRTSFPEADELSLGLYSEHVLINTGTLTS